MIILPKSIFLHMPRTGGTWTRKAIVLAAPHCKIYPKPHWSLKQARTKAMWKLVKDRPAWAFVRHPVDWYVSYWKRRAHHGWQNDRDIDIKCRADSVEDFMELVLDKLPHGWLTRFYERFTGPKGKEISYVGRYENLRADVLRAMTRHGEAFNPGVILTYGAVNQSHKFVASRTRVPAGLRARIEDAEADAMVRYGYIALR